MRWSIRMTTADTDYFRRVSDLLGMTLQAAVPLNTYDLLRRSYGLRQPIIDRWASKAAYMVAYHGDMLLFKSKARTSHRKDCSNPKECDCLTGTAEVFNHLARGIAAASFQPGGICTFGLQFCAFHYPEGRAVGRNHHLCLVCMQNEEINLTSTSMMSSNTSMTGTVTRTELAKARGRAYNAALFIALLSGPYNPDTDKVRKQAMRRWQQRNNNG